MKKIKKGDYGYRNHFKRKQLFIIALLALFIIAQLVGRSFTDNDSVKKILTVMAIVTVLPAANLASPLPFSNTIRRSRRFMRHICRMRKNLKFSMIWF